MRSVARHLYGRLAISSLACLIIVLSSSVQAQIDPGLTGIIQNTIQVGLIYVPRHTNACNYREYWYLGPDYIYPGSPGSGQSIVTHLQYAQSQPVFEDADDFYAFAREHMPGGKRVVVLVAELDECGA